LDKVGFTTTIPVEILFAAKVKPVDLNNIFITSVNPEKYIEEAESEGFPRNTCAWIKGIYATVAKRKYVDAIIGVVEGDCSNTKAMLEVMETEGIESIPFAYPLDRSYDFLKYEFEKLKKYFNVNDEKLITTKKRIDKIREKLIILDDLTWKHNKATGLENHLWLVSSSDFFSDLEEFESKLDYEIGKISNRKPFNDKIRLGYIGVPPIFTNLYEKIEEYQGRVVYNEVQRQFSMPFGIDNQDMVEVYLEYTYPYGVKERIIDIKKQIKQRKIDGIIHYTQSFCFRGIEDIVIRKALDVPILTLEGDRPGEIDSRTILRLETFIDMIAEGK
jgi:benzoyl-CoA reductase/2-hydroxyglutaryl-CoA dehydratase subunit BcrC/BadD/HgdB